MLNEYLVKCNKLKITISISNRTKKRGAPFETPLLHHSSINNQTFLVSNKLLLEIV